MSLNFNDPGSLFLKARHKKGYTQLSMAQELGICQKTYSYIESGLCKPDIIKFLKFAHVTETHPMHFVELLIDGEPSWKTIEMKEERLMDNIEKLKAEIVYLRAQNDSLSDCLQRLADKLG
jgi:DNA-binding XRE family transcriptional regulator